MVRPAENKYLKSNLHTHTVYSDGKHTVEENILSAIDKGFVSIGISDHSFTEHDLSYCMKKENEKSYVEEIRAIRDKYRDMIEVYAGIELDGFSKLDKTLFDYTIGSCHYVKTCDGYFSVDHCREGHLDILERYFDNDPNLFARAYFDIVLECISLQKPDIIGHFDLVAKFGAMKEDSDTYLNMARETLEACISVTPFVELNTGAISRGVRNVVYPAPYLLKEMKAFGGKAVLSSDSHDRGNLDFAFDNTVELLKFCGFESIWVMKNGSLCETPI